MKTVSIVGLAVVAGLAGALVAPTMTDATGADDSPFTTVTIAGPGGERAGVVAGLDDLVNEAGVPIRYVGVGNLDGLVADAVASGRAPSVIDPATGETVTVDVLLTASPTGIADLARADVAVPAAGPVVATANRGWDRSWLEHGIVDGRMYGVPTKSDLASLVWYRPSTFVDPVGDPYPIPSTWDELLALTDTILDNGRTPWCAAIGQGPMTGSFFTDWVEDRVLGSAGPRVYDGWVSNDVSFADVPVENAWNDVVDLWHTPGAVFEGLATTPAPGVGIAETPFGNAGINQLFGGCLLHRQASFIAELIAGAEAAGALPPGTLASFATFTVPGDEAARDVVTVQGLYAVTFRADREVTLTQRHLDTSEYADARRAVDPLFLTAVEGQDLSLAHPVTVGFVETMQGADELRFSASDLMPRAVRDAFLSEGTRAVVGDGNTAVAFDGTPIAGTTVDDATHRLADLFCEVAQGRSCR